LILETKGRIHYHRREEFITYISPKENVYVTDIKPDEDLSQFVTRVSVQPGEVHRQNITNFSTGDSLMVTAAEDDRVFELVVSNCDDQSLVGLEVMSRPGPSTANSFGCR